MTEKTPAAKAAFETSNLFDYATPGEIAAHLEELTLVYISRTDHTGNRSATPKDVEEAVIMNARLIGLVYALYEAEGGG